MTRAANAYYNTVFALPLADSEGRSLIAVAFFLPLGLYCLVLGLINRRRRPLMVPGTWDFAGLLFAASGFLAFSVPAMLTGFSERWRLFWLTADPDELPPAPEVTYELWRFLAGSYFVAVIALASYVMWRRRRQTAVYNVNPSVFVEVLEGALDACGISWARTGNCYFLRSGKSVPAVMAEDSEDIQAGQGGLAVRPDPAEPPVARGDAEREPTAHLELDLAPWLRHVTLRWDCGDDQSLRHDVEQEVERVLEEVRTRNNPVGAWLLVLGSFFVAAALMAFILVLAYRFVGG